MSHQRAQAIERRVVDRASGTPREAGFDGVETCNLQAGNQFGIERRHATSVGPVPPSVEVQTSTGHPFRPSAAVQALNLVRLIDAALDAAGLTHEQACDLMVDEAGKALDPSLWNRMRRTGNLPIGRMRNLPLAFWWHFVAGLGEPAQMQCTHADIAEIAVMKVALAFEEVAHAFRHMRRRA